VETSRDKLRRAATAVTRSTTAAWAAVTHHLPHPPKTWKSAGKARQARLERDLALIEHTDTLYSALLPYKAAAGKGEAAGGFRKVFDGRYQTVNTSTPGHEKFFGVGVMGFTGFAMDGSAKVAAWVEATEVALRDSALPELRAAVAALGGRPEAATEWIHEADCTRERLQTAAVQAATEAVARCVPTSVDPHRCPFFPRRAAAAAASQRGLERIE
jgi:hypothetical protein